MKARRDKVSKYVGEDGCGERILGYVERSDETIAMYILERPLDEPYVDFNLIVGKWGNEENLREGKVSFFSTLLLNQTPHFLFKDPTAKQCEAYSKLSEKSLSRDELLSSPDLENYKEILDAVWALEGVAPQN